jgi:hypothetical protein
MNQEGNVYTSAEFEERTVNDNKSTTLFVKKIPVILFTTK